MNMVPYCDFEAYKRCTILFMDELTSLLQMKIFFDSLTVAGSMKDLENSDSADCV
jgi:hypothetical protein